MYHLNNFIQNKILLILNVRNIRSLINLKKIILHLSLKNSSSNSKKIIPISIILSLLSTNKSLLILSKKTIITLKVKKGMPSSCKVTLRKKQMFLFLNNFLLINFYKLKNLWSCKENSIDKFTVTLRISELYFFPVLEKFFDFFEDLPFLTVTLVLSDKSNKLFSKKIFSILGILNNKK